MKRWIYKKEILGLIENQKFNSEKEFEEYITPRLIKLLNIKPSQIENQITTTCFDYTLSNCADIVIRTDDDFKKVILVIELKLTKSVDRFENSDYTKAVKQLHKYCQDVRSLYGVLLTDETCFIYKYNYFRYDNEPERNGENRIPNIKRIENKMTLNAFIEFVLHKKSLKYTYLFIISALLLGNLLWILLIFFIRLIFLAVRAV